MASHADPGDKNPSIDPVALSVAAYTDQAEEYEATHSTKMLDRAEQFASSLPAGSSILDAGCGPGRDLARFAARGHDVYGVDLNPTFVSMASSYGPTYLCDLREVESVFSTGMFDGIWACASLVHLSDSDAVEVLGQFAKLLRADGKLYVAVKSVGETGWLDEPDGRRWYTVWNPETFADAVAKAGFAVDQVVRGVFVEIWATRNR